MNDDIWDVIVRRLLSITDEARNRYLEGRTPHERGFLEMGTEDLRRKSVREKRQIVPVEGGKAEPTIEIDRGALLNGTITADPRGLS
jgi:hypothetical protein